MVPSIARRIRHCAAAILVGAAVPFGYCGMALSGVIVEPPEPPADYSFNIAGAVEKSKSTAINEAIHRDKDIRIDVTTMAVAARFTEALSILSQANDGNTFSTGTSLSEAIATTGNGNTGMTVINQAAGNSNNQGSSSSVAATSRPGEPVFSEAQAAIGQGNGGSAPGNEEGQGPIASLSNYVETVLSANAGTRAASISESINDNAGMTHVNQSVGTANNQANAVALATSLGSGGVILSDAALQQSNMALMVNEFAVVRSVAFIGSVAGNSGTVGVNQSAGSFANQANIVANGIAIVN